MKQHIEIVHYGSCVKINTFEYKGLKTFHIPGIEKAFDALHKETEDDPFTLIIETGAEHGGLTQLIADHPISKHAIIRVFKDPGHYTAHSYPAYRKPPVFSADHPKIVCEKGLLGESADEVLGRVFQNRTLFLCNHTNKKDLFRWFGHVAKEGDIIIANNYCSTREKFNEEFRDKVWNWMELDDTEATSPFLRSFLSEEFMPYAMCCKRKN